MASIKILGPAYPFRGGIAAGNERLAEEFIKEGHNVSLETFTIQYPSVLFPGKTQFVDGDAPANLKIKRTFSSVNPFSWIKAGRRIKKEKPDMLVIRYWLPFLAPCFGTILRFVRRNKHTKIICLADNIVPHEKRPGDKILTRYFVRSIHGLVAMSKKVLNDALSFNKSLPVELTVHPLFDNFGKPVTTEKAKQKLGLDTTFNYLLFFGFIRDYKGLDILLEAFADERLREFPVKLIVAGEFYSKPEKYLQLIKRLNLEDQVVLKTDFIPNEEVSNYFCASDLVTQPYKSATQSGVTQIGFHFEKAMLVTNVGGLSEIIKHNKMGYVVEPNPEEISEAIIDFFSHNRKEKFEIATAEEKKKFSWANMTKAIFNVQSKINQK